MATPAQIAANQQNAQKSTGPKTEAGKLISRKNSLKHGLTGSGEVLTPAASELTDSLITTYLEDLQPQNSVEQSLAALAATCCARLQTYNVSNLVEIDAQRVLLPLTLEAQRRQQAEADIAAFIDDPRPNLLAISQSTTGLDWQIDQWTSLRALAENPESHWTKAHLDRALALLDSQPDPLFPDPNERTLARLVLASQPLHALESAVAALVIPGPLSTIPLDWLEAANPPLPTPAEAREALAEIAASEIAGLEARRTEVAAIEQTLRAIAPLRVDPTSFPNARLHLRYEATLTRQLNSALLRLRQLQQDSRNTRTPAAPSQYRLPPRHDLHPPTPTPAASRQHPAATQPPSPASREPGPLSRDLSADTREPRAELPPQQIEPNSPTSFFSPIPVPPGLTPASTP